MCRAPLAGRGDQETCSPRCRAKRHRQRQAAARADRDQALRRLLATARTALEAAERLLHGT